MGWACMELFSGEHAIGVEYLSDIDFEVAPNEPGQAAALSLLTLPKSEVEVKSLTEPVTMEGKDWARLSNELDTKIKLKKRDKNVMFIYRVNFQNPDKLPVHFRLMINDKEVQQGRTSS